MGALALCVPASRSGAQTVADEVSFERDWPVQAIPFYRVSVHGDGRGWFTTEREPAGDGSGTMPIFVSEATRAKLFAVEAVLMANKGCETGSKKIAQTGKKTLTLKKDGHTFTCTFNYSDEKHLLEAVDAFGGIERTMEEAPKLVHLRRFDRLGLDAEVGTFVDAVKSGRAIELGNIAAILRTLAGDGELMDRVRDRATNLLEMADAGK